MEEEEVVMFFKPTDQPLLERISCRESKNSVLSLDMLVRWLVQLYLDR